VPHSAVSSLISEFFSLSTVQVSQKDFQCVLGTL